MTTKVLEPAFQGVGQKAGIEIWRIENLKPVPLPKSDYGRFYSGDSYIVLKTTGKAGAHMYDIYFWLGKDTSQDEAGTAATKAVELDAILGGRAVEYRELQGHESNRFLSCFKPCVMPLEGGETSGDGKHETKLYMCRGKRVVRLKQVPFARSSLNHDDVFILDTEDKIYQFNGANSSMPERTKVLDVVQFLKDKHHKGKCKVAIVDDGKAEGESDEFWNMFGGFAPLGKRVATEDDIIPERTPAKLYCIAGGQLQDIGGELSKSLLHNEKCYLLYCGSEVFVWVGRATKVEDRKTAMQAAEEFITKQNLPKSVCVTRINQGHETNSFRSNFGSWTHAAAPPVEDNRGKIAALLKQQGGGLKGQTKTSPVEEESTPLLGDHGKLEVWRIDGEAKKPVSEEDIGKFYSGDCYICHYSYHSSEKREDHYVCCWIGKDSVQEDQKMASQLATSMFNSLKGKGVQGRVYQGKEPPQFVALFHPMLVLKGGLSSGYKSYIAKKGLTDETYRPDATALIEILGTSEHNNKALQVEAVATSMNSYACFVLQSGSAVFTWYGNQSSVEQQQLAAKVVECLKSRVPVKFVKEGKESLAFWLPLGGKKEYTSKKLTQEIVKDPHMFAVSLNKGKLEIEEVYNYDQDDLLAEDVMILDTHAEVFIWVGQSVDPKEKQSVFEIGQKYVELAASVDGLSPYVPLYRVPEGSEPCFFTTYFSWDHAKATVSANSFKKKAMLLFGAGSMENQEKSQKTKSSGATQRASAMAALTNAFRSSTTTTKSTHTSPRAPSKGSQRAAAIAALSNVLTAEKKTQPDSPTRRHPKKFVSSEPGSPASHHKRFPSSEPGSPKAAAAAPPLKNSSEHHEASPQVIPEPTPETSKEDSSTKQTTEEHSPTKQTTEEHSSTDHPTEDDSSMKETAHDQEEGGSSEDHQTYSYEQLTTKSKNPATGIDFKNREAYLSPEDFEAVFKMTKEAFYKFPRWKQDQLKKKVDLF